MGTHPIIHLDLFLKSIYLSNLISAMGKPEGFLVEEGLYKMRGSGNSKSGNLERTELCQPNGDSVCLFICTVDKTVVANTLEVFVIHSPCADLLSACHALC